MSELLSLVIHTARAAVRGRNDLILENLLLRHQLQVALRPERRLPLRRRDRFLWVLVRQLRPDWRRYLLCVHPETVIRWPKWLAIVLAVEIENPARTPSAVG